MFESNPLITSILKNRVHSRINDKQKTRELYVFFLTGCSLSASVIFCLRKFTLTYPTQCNILTSCNVLIRSRFVNCLLNTSAAAWLNGPQPKHLQLTSGSANHKRAVPGSSLGGSYSNKFLTTDTSYWFMDLNRWYQAKTCLQQLASWVISFPGSVNSDLLCWQTVEPYNMHSSPLIKPCIIQLNRAIEKTGTGMSNYPLGSDSKLYEVYPALMKKHQVLISLSNQSMLSCIGRERVWPLHDCIRS